MLADLLRVIIDVIAYVWPLRIVEQNQRGCYFVAGWWVATVGPGVWPFVPFLMAVKPVLVQPHCVPLPRQDVTLRDGRTASFSVTYELVVLDPKAALIQTDRWDENASEHVAGVFGEYLPEVDPDKLEAAYGKRRRLLDGALERINEETVRYGVQVTRVWFQNFVTIRTYRFIAGE